MCDWYLLCLTDWKILITLLLISSLIPAQCGEGDLDGDDSVLDIASASQQNQAGPVVSPLLSNRPPQQPSIAAGPISGPPAVACRYSSIAIDPDGDPLSYIFYWDDGNHSRLGPFGSGTMAAADHIWSRAGTYQVRVMAIDNNSSSPWSPPLVVVVNSPPNQPAIPSGQSLAQPGIKAQFSTSGEDPDGDLVRYIFDWGDGSVSRTDWTKSGRAESMEHSWQRAASYEIRARTEDGANASSPWSPPLVVVVNSPPNRPAIPSGQSLARPGIKAQFSTSGEDPDGDLVRYIFDWGDGSVSRTDWTKSGRAESMHHSWEKAGSYEIRARVEDSTNATSPWSESISIVVNTLPSRPDQLSGPGYGYAMVPYHFQTSAIDQDGDFLNYTFDWGDGTTDTIDLIGPGINASLNHTWTGPGAYQIRAIALDRMGGDWSEQRRINIDPNEPPDPPRDLYGVRSGFTGNGYSYFTMTRDPDGDRVMHVLDWGDGTTIETDHVRSGSLQNASHIWSRPGEYLVRVGSMDEKGAPSQWSGPFLVAIKANDPPEQPAMPSGPAAGQSLISHKYATSARDPDGDAVKYVFDWGDGTTSWTGLGYLSSGEESAVSHKWIQPGVYKIKVAALDDKGLISDWSGALLVKME